MISIKNLNNKDFFLKMLKNQKDISDFQEIWSRRIEDIRNSELDNTQSNRMLDQFIADYKYLIIGCTNELINNNKYVFSYMVGDLGLAIEQARNKYKKNKRLENRETLINFVDSIAKIFRRFD